MGWEVIFHPEFFAEFLELAETVQDNILAKALVLQQFGPQLGRPHADTLFGSRFSNMKELRLDSDKGTWRIAFAFDPKRKVVLLIAGDKTGIAQKAFYRNLIRKADYRFEQHLISLNEN